MRLDDLITYGWALWCPVAGQFWEWGIDPEDELSVFMLEDSWFIVADEGEEFMFEASEDFGPNIKFLGSSLFIKATQWPPLHVWVGVALRLLLEYYPQIACAYVVTRERKNGRRMRVVLNRSAKERLEKIWEEARHGFVFRPQSKCQICFIKGLCWSLQEV